MLAWYWHWSCLCARMWDVMLVDQISNLLHLNVSRLSSRIPIQMLLLELLDCCITAHYMLTYMLRYFFFYFVQKREASGPRLKRLRRWFVWSLAVKRCLPPCWWQLYVLWCLSKIILSRNYSLYSGRLFQNILKMGRCYRRLSLCVMPTERSVVGL